MKCHRRYRVPLTGNDVVIVTFEAYEESHLSETLGVNWGYGGSLLRRDDAGRLDVGRVSNNIWGHGSGCLRAVWFMAHCVG